MRKLMVALLAACLVWGILGCKNDTQIQSMGDLNPQTTGFVDYTPPPYQISFSNIEEYEAFVEAAELPQEELQQFLAKNFYDMNCVEDREDVLWVINLFAELPFPLLEKAKLSGFNFCFDNSELFVRYELGEVVVVYALNAEKNSAEGEFGEGSLEKIEVENYTELYCYGNWNNQQGSFSYGANVKGYFLNIRVLNSTREAADKIVRETTYKGI